MKPSILNGHYIVSEDKMDFYVPVEIHFNRFGESLHPHKNGNYHPEYQIHTKLLLQITTSMI